MTWIASIFNGLRGKLIALSVLPLLALALTTGISFNGFSFIGGMLEESYEVYVPNTRLLGQINLNRANIGYFAFAALANRNDPKNRETFISLLERSLSSYKEAVDEYIKGKKLPGEDEIFARMKSNYPKYIEMTEQVRALLKKMQPEADENIGKIIDKGGPWQVLQIEVDNTITKLYEKYAAQTAEQNRLQKEKRQQLATLILMVALLSSVVLLTGMLFVANRVSGSVSKVVQNLNAISREIADTIKRLSSSGSSLSSASTDVAASLEETVASLEELSSMVQRNSEHAKEASSIADSSTGVAQEGESEINSLIQAMHQISSDSKKIEDIIHVIDDIAFQTNLLALNAAVEAARAGEQGKGFAVVADAVRSLAQRSASAAKEINALIKDNVEKTEKGRGVADNSGQVLSRIVSSVQRVAVLNKEISQANNEQATGIQQISLAMNQLDRSSQGNAAASEEIASTAGDIDKRAQALKEQVAVLSRAVIGA